jgi:hypothetical protein
MEGSMELSIKLYNNIIKARKETTYLMLVFIPSLAIFFYFYKYTNFHLPLYGVIVLNIIFFALHIYKSNLELRFKDFGISRCPSCNNVVERSQVLDKKLPTNCKACGLAVKKGN